MEVLMRQITLNVQQLSQVLLRFYGVCIQENNSVLFMATRFRNRRKRYGKYPEISKGLSHQVFHTTVFWTTCSN